MSIGSSAYHRARSSHFVGTFPKRIIHQNQTMSHMRQSDMAAFPKLYSEFSFSKLGSTKIRSENALCLHVLTSFLHS